MVYLAHVDADNNREQSMVDHLKQTAETAAMFAQAFSCGDMGYLCGILHDIGKYSQKFQRRIRGSGEAVDHSTAGAQVAFFSMNNLPVAFCVAGHHGGLPDMGNKRLSTADEPTFFGKMRRKVGAEIEDYSAYKSEITFSAPIMPKELLTDHQSRFFFTRMLYSCLVDADYLDTEAFMSNGLVQRGVGETIAQLGERLDKAIAPWWNAKKELNKKRSDILRTLIEAGSHSKGLFSLTVPTGGGKTVSSMAFALRHALSNGMRRIIYVIPYTSIIEQTQQVFEKIFGENNVVAHYASLDYSTDENGNITDKRYLATENWDAPVIVTTAVQFFESLYANRSSRCRKLHNIANSIIIFDEAQMLPVPYLSPCVNAIAQLVKNYGCSAVLCTATQPALDRLFEKQGFQIRELYPKAAEAYEYFRRVQYVQLGALSDEELAERLNGEHQALCIVNTRKQAQQIYKMLGKEESYHLSTTMYPAHRRRVLAEIRDKLKEGKPCRVVSTSLVEAGVDVDFPTVYRALAGLDSMIQAGGRCNREGTRNPKESIVYIFETSEKPPENMAQNVAAAERVLRKYEDIACLDAIQEYFNFLYYTLKSEADLDQKQIIREIESGTMPFATVAERFRIIEETQRTIYIPREEGAALIEQMKAGRPSRSLLRKLGQYAVGVYPHHFNALIRSGEAEQVSEQAAVLCNPTLYCEKTGLAFSVNFGQEYIT